MVVALAPQEQAGNPAFASLGVDQAASALQPGGNMEGKEARFGIAASTLFAAITTSRVVRRGRTRCTTRSCRSAAPCRWS